MNPVVVIPARMAASRLPGKPLADIHGKPMIVHVLDRAREADLGPVLVACGDAEIAEAVQAAGGRAVLTDPALPSGTDRVHAALVSADPDRRYDVVINLQGDVPTLDPRQLRSIVTPLDDGAYDIGTMVVPILSDEEAATESFVKAVCAFAEGSDIARALYFTRTPAPWGPGPRWHHIGLYAFRRLALDRFVSLPPSLLEMREKLEQLRAMEAGMTIACVRNPHGLFGVDTPDDLERARALLNPKGAV